MDSIIINPFTDTDLTPIIQLLKESHLPTNDIAYGKQILFAAMAENEIVGCVGIEMFGSVGLLRSVAVSDKYRNKGIGSDMYEKAIEYSVENGLTRLFLLTTTAEKYFERKGWKRIDREFVPDLVKKSEEFASMCPSTAVCMELSLLPDIAQKTFADGFNCAQSVFYPFAIEAGLLPEQALKLATGFGAGMVYRGETCGAITGAMMAIGMAEGRSQADDHDSKEKTYVIINELYKKFRHKHGSILCKELLNLQNTDPESWEKAFNEDKFNTHCPLFVKDAVLITENLLKK